MGNVSYVTVIRRNVTIERWVSKMILYYLIGVAIFQNTPVAKGKKHALE